MGFARWPSECHDQIFTVRTMANVSRMFRSFVPALYGVAALLTIAPFTEMLGAAGRIQPGLASWRFGVLGLGFNVLIVQTLGLALALGVAALLGHRRVLRGAAAAAIIAAVLVVAGIARFLMDFSSIQALVDAGDRAAFNAATLRALILASLAVPVLVTLGGRGWTAAAVTSAPIDCERRTPRERRVIPFPGPTARLPDARWPRR